MIDVIIPIIKGGSHKDNQELKFALRSIEKYLTGYRNIVIVGHLPDFINRETVIHIPFNDGPKKQVNLRNKIIEAFEDERVSETVWFSNDDIYLLPPPASLKPFTASNFPYFFDGTLDHVSEKAARISRIELLEAGNPIKHFDTHFPIVYRKDLFIEAMRHYSEDCSIKSIYCNHWHIEGQECKDLKISSHLRTWTIKEAIRARPCFSTGDFGMNRDMIEVLNELFPEPSKYELTNQQIKAA